MIRIETVFFFGDEIYVRSGRLPQQIMRIGCNTKQCIRLGSRLVPERSCDDKPPPPIVAGILYEAALIDNRPDRRTVRKQKSSATDNFHWLRDAPGGVAGDTDSEMLF